MQSAASAVFYPMIEPAAVAVAPSAALMLDGWLLGLSLGLGWCLLVPGKRTPRCDPVYTNLAIGVMLKS